jgi:sulfatase modifying factor 1
VNGVEPLGAKSTLRQIGGYLKERKMKRNSKIAAIVLITAVCTSCLASCPTADLNGDCFVDFEDFAILASQWLTTDPCVPQDMAYIRGGTFQMGDSLDGESDALPVHTVTLSYFYIGKHDITNQQYCNFLNSAAVKVISGTVYASTDSGNSYPYCDTSAVDTYSQIAYSGSVFSVRTKGSRSMVNDPMICVSWYGAAAYCNWRSQQEGKEQCYDTSDPNWPCDFTKNGYHLPTEAQWEYAARGGFSGKRFPWGDVNTISHSQANYYSCNGCYSYDLGPPWGFDPTWSADDIYPYTSPVGSFAANGYGLYDMAGNVWQWCNDWWGLYSSSPQTNPTGPASGYHPVLRGGGWFSHASGCRVACRYYDDDPDGRYYYCGFRVSLGLN